MFWSREKKEFLIETGVGIYVISCNDKNEEIVLSAMLEKSRWLKINHNISYISNDPNLNLFVNDALGKKIPKNNRCLVRNLNIGSFLIYYRAPINRSIGPIIRIWEKKSGSGVLDK